ncbi:MAG: PAS domain-containing protein [Candidatus Delongbacteria bacterium]|jgi:PAS domain S-box-containing protein|nr:PAS domain-containing protein [Candidatus Delongbacteria bacterium]
MKSCDEIGCNVYDNLSFAVLIIDKDHNVVSSNKSAKEIFKNNTDEGIKCYALTHNETKPCWQNGEDCAVKKTFTDKKQHQVVHKHIYNGKEVFEEITATPIFDKNNEIKFVVEEIRDITKLLKLQTIVNHLKNEIETLHGIIPICSSCKKVRDDEGYWEQVEEYLSTRSDARFSHSICPDCLKELYPEIAEKRKKEGK